MSNDSTFTDGTVPEDADVSAEGHVTPDGQTVDDGETRLDEGLVSDGDDAKAQSQEQTGLEHGLGAP